VTAAAPVRMQHRAAVTRVRGTKAARGSMIAIHGQVVPSEHDRNGDVVHLRLSRAGASSGREERSRLCRPAARLRLPGSGHAGRAFRLAETAVSAGSSSVTSSPEVVRVLPRTAAPAPRPGMSDGSVTPPGAQGTYDRRRGKHETKRTISFSS
jgi:hypothetical protein